MQRLLQFLSYQAQIFSTCYTRYGEQNEVLDFFIFYILFKLKNNFHTTDTTKIENYVLTKTINFFLSSQNTFLKYGYLIFSGCI